MKFKSNSIQGTALIKAREAHAKIKALRPTIEAVETIQTEVKVLFPKETLVMVGPLLVATLGAPKRITNTNHVSLEAFLAKHGEKLENFQTVTMSAPSWNWTLPNS